MSLFPHSLPWTLVGCAAAIVLSLTSAVNAAPPAEADDEPYLPGLVATYRDAGGNMAVRLDHQPAWHWGEAPPDPRLAPGEFSAVWRGHLFFQARGDHRFCLFGTGEVELKVGGKIVVPRQVLRQNWADSAPAAFPADFLPFELSFRRTGRDARLIVCWSGPQFELEPIPPRLLFHPREQPIGSEFERGQLLSRVLRCGTCHGGETLPPAPALDHLGGNLSRDWLARWLSTHEQPTPQSPRRMPAFGLTPSQASAIADWLLEASQPVPPLPGPPPEVKRAPLDKKAPPKSRPDAATGERLFVSLGCLACHSWRDLGASGWLGGGDLTHIADKRSPSFFATWLADPARLNRDHRMPVFSLTPDERTSLALFLAEQKASPTKANAVERSTTHAAEGRQLVEQFRCAACHRLPGQIAALTSLPPRLDQRSNWEQSCAGKPDTGKNRPGYQLGSSDVSALRLYFTSRRPDTAGHRDGLLLLADHNCLACHAREGAREAIPLLPPLLSDKLAGVAKRYPDLAPLLPALTPPALNSVGDKLTDLALADTIARRAEPHRPYLHVRMPRFRLSDEERNGFVQHLVSTDRVPPRGTTAARLDPAQQDRFTLAGGRLVGSDGFGCTSCHQVGSVQPSQAQLNARGPDISQLQSRIRRPWFDRWLHNPARIVPRMEMPSVQIAVAGVLGDKLDDQIAAVWHVLNQPGFEPPPPNPIRVLRLSGNQPNAEPVIVTDVLQQSSKVWVRPFLVGLANRHNVLLDLDGARLARWTVGDAARQRTKGKTWFWELGGTSVFDPELAGPDLILESSGRELAPQALGQFLTEVDAWETQETDVVLRARLAFAAPEGQTVTLPVQRRFAPVPSGMAHEIVAGPLPAGTSLRMRVVSGKSAANAKRQADMRSLLLGDRFGSRIVLHEPAGATFAADGTSVLLAPDANGNVRLVLHYLSDIPVDRLPELPPMPVPARKPELVEIAPGFVGERLPLPPDIMPTGLSWRPDGKLVFCSLKGQAFEARDTDGDGAEDQLTLLVDGLPSPYGISAGPDYVDVSAKHSLVRVPASSGAGRRIEVVASGWGYTDDYHDWAIGLPRNERGEYFLGIPCQQDKRSLAAARFHGNVLRLVPRTPSADDPRRFTLVPVSAGHRFPTGLALNRDGELFATDNQGNYNPFNELNHVRPGAHFGFINALEKGKPAPPLTPPAIDIPHPWVRSVNGICFLDTPRQLGRTAFGPFEGHLVGCEYDTRRLVRMSLQRVGDTYQGAVYPLSIPPTEPERGPLGPVSCAVSPRGELFVGGLRDSGWGAGNNVGEVLRIRVEPEKLPCGIAEVRASRDGFLLDFTRPIDRALAGRPDSYTVQSYRRESTPAYGGPDRDRRTEKVTDVLVAPDGRRATLKLTELRPGFVYELRLKNLTPGGGEFHPAEAHCTLRVAP